MSTTYTKDRNGKETIKKGVALPRNEVLKRVEIKNGIAFVKNGQYQEPFSFNLFKWFKRLIEESVRNGNY